MYPENALLAVVCYFTCGPIPSIRVGVDAFVDSTLVLQALVWYSSN